VRCGGVRVGLSRLEGRRSPNPEDCRKGHQQDQEPKQHHAGGYDTDCAQRHKRADARTSMMASARNGWSREPWLWARVSPVHNRRHTRTSVSAGARDLVCGDLVCGDLVCKHLVCRDHSRLHTRASMATGTWNLWLRNV